MTDMRIIEPTPMNDDEQNDYDRVARIIAFIVEHRNAQPELTAIATHAGLSVYQVERLFMRWAGLTPKRFLQALTLAHAKELLRETHSVMDAAYETGLSSGSRLYDHFVQLEGITPGEYKDGGRALRMEFGTGPTPYGEAFVALTDRGICKLAFVPPEDPQQPLRELLTDWPNAMMQENGARAAAALADVFAIPSGRRPGPLSVHVRGTNFQMSVWRALLSLPPGQMWTYGDLAQYIGKPRAARTVASAVAANPVAHVIPCHRVILQSGRFGSYHWGSVRKAAMHLREWGSEPSMGRDIPARVAIVKR